MLNFSSCSFSAVLARLVLAFFFLLLRFPAVAQAPAWQSAQAVAVATAAAINNHSVVRATAVDVAGNVFLAGSFTRTVMLGATMLTSLGDDDAFVAKFNPATNQFVWAQRAGGAGADEVNTLAVSGTSVYVSGEFVSPTADFGPVTLTNAGPNGNYDMYVAKLTDAGSTSSFIWAQRAGGTNFEAASALAVSGSSVYVAGYFTSATASFGATTLTNAGTAPNSDMYVAKLTDAGSTGSFAWAQRAGGTNDDQAFALAVSGSSVYVAGHFSSLTVNFGPATLTNAGPNGNYDTYVAKLTDAGSTSNFVWAQRAGGTGNDFATKLAVSGSSVYVAGYFSSPTAEFGLATLTNASTAFSYDMFVAKLSDTGSTGSFNWAQRAGGAGSDQAGALAVSGNSVYVAGYFDSFAANFGPAALTSVGSNNVFVAKLSDAGSTGSFVWAQQAGGMGYDAAFALAVSGTSVYVAGYFTSLTASFGSITLTNAYTGSSPTLGFLASLTDPTLTATTTSRALAPALLYPNPAHHAATLRLPAGTTPAPLTLRDALGRTVRHYPVPAGYEAALDLRGLSAGLYLLQGAGPALRLMVE
jgi:hypothetical protein